MRTRPLALLTASMATLGVLALPLTAHAAAGNQIVPISPTDTQAQILAKAAAVTPSPRQLSWQREELTGFVHFGPNTYSGREVGLGTESPDSVQPTNLDTGQWVKTFSDAGFKKVILVAKHHDGMLMFPSEYSRYGIAAGTWLGGKGDIVKSFTDSAHAAGIKVGIYLSPADLHENQPGGRFGNGSKAISATIPSSGNGNGTTFAVTADDYNRYYMNTLYELLTRYGTIDEVWFDGYDPTGGRQSYNFHDWYHIVRTLQPTAAIFGGDARWVGNEDGNARTSEWSVIPNTGTGTVDDPRSPTFGESSEDMAQDDRLTTASSYLSWYPAECDARMEQTWFWHPNQPPKSLDALMSMYFNSVGRNCQLLLDMVPDKTGRFPAADTTRLSEFGAKIRSTFATDLATTSTASSDSGGDPSKVVDGNDSTGWQPTGTTGSLVLDLGRPRNLTTILLQENIQVGQRVKSFAVDTWTGSAWQQAATGTTIGYKRLLRLAAAVNTRKVRLRVLDSRALPPVIATVGLYDDGHPANLAAGKPATQSSTHSNGEAYRAVDGNTNGSFPAGSVTHTTDTTVEQSPWWQVDLGASNRIGGVSVWNRTDCCGNRLSNYWVFVSDTPFDAKLPPAQQAGVWSNHQSSQAGSPTTLSVGRSGRYVMVQLDGTGPLSLAEVQVFSAPNTYFKGGV